MATANTLRRMGVCLASGLLLASVGCGWTHGRYQSDPMLGSFNRPIAATPPIFTGGDPGVSPAYDTGARLGLGSPDVVMPQKLTDEHILILPTFQGGLNMGGFLRNGTAPGGSGGSASQMISPPVPTGNGGANFSRPLLQPLGGPRLSAVETESEHSAVFVPGVVAPLPANVTAASPHRNVFTSMSSGSSIEPNLPRPKADPVQEALKNPEQIATIEQANQVLTQCGAKTQALEQVPTGEWRFVCTMGDGIDHRRYESKHREPIEAVRAVLIQVSSEK